MQISRHTLKTQSNEMKTHPDAECLAYLLPSWTSASVPTRGQFRVEVHHHCRAISPRHNHCPHSHLFALCNRRERGTLSSLWCDLCMSAQPAGGWGVGEIHSLCWGKKAFNIDSFIHSAQGGLWSACVLRDGELVLVGWSELHKYGRCDYYRYKMKRF